MTLNVAKELAELRRMSVADLRLRYVEVFGGGQVYRSLSAVGSWERQVCCLRVGLL